LESPLPLDSRKREILKAVVSDYTATGVPVGSHALAAHLSAWSSATIRNELSTLVDVGYLLQPHTSAGRVPSDLGYRYYVDFLMEEKELAAAERRQLEPAFRDLPAEMEAVLEVGAMVLAQATEALSIVTGPRSLTARLKHIDLVALTPQSVLVLVVLEGNLIRQNVVQVTEAAEQEELSKLAQMLNQTWNALSADDIGALPPPPGVHTLRDQVCSHVLDILRGIDAHQGAIVVHDGMRNLLRQPEFEDVAQLEAVLEIIDEERVLGEMLTSLDTDKGLNIVIGRESGVDQLSQCSLVLTTYAAGGGRIGTLGILGPTRMRYDQVAPRVRFVARKIGEALKRVLDS
jgi:heat-inducible transcriptional repressor